jgi:hypothetical protein
LLSLSSSSFCCRRSFFILSRLKGVRPVGQMKGRQGLPLAFDELEAKAVQQELVFIGENLLSTGLWRGKELELFEAIQRDVLVY